MGVFANLVDPDNTEYENIPKKVEPQVVPATVESLNVSGNGEYMDNNTTSTTPTTPTSV